MCISVTDVFVAKSVCDVAGIKNIQLDFYAECIEFIGEIVAPGILVACKPY